jgi:hypothetical protein
MILMYSFLVRFAPSDLYPRSSLVMYYILICMYACMYVCTYVLYMCIPSLSVLDVDACYDRSTGIDGHSIWPHLSTRVRVV